MIPRHEAWLHWLFAGSMVALVALVGLAMWQERERPAQVAQRVIAPLGVVDRCELCHDADQHPGKILDSHPPDRFGCTPCHGGQGYATTRKAAHDRSPDWQQPLKTPSERLVACASCHQGSSPPEQADVAAGRQAFARLGCAGCHPTTGAARPDFAPDLSGLSDQVTPGWLRMWLQTPQKLDPRHRMPTFALQTDQIEALVAMLLERAGPKLLALPAHSGDADRGQQAVAQLRCATCHRIDGRGGNVGPDLSIAGSKLPAAWLYSWLMDARRLRPATPMPKFCIAEEQAIDIVAYIREQCVPDSGTTPWQEREGPVEPALAEKGRQLFGELGCSGCHPLAGKRAEVAGITLDNFGERRVEDLPVPTRGPVAADLAAWVAQKVLKPDAFDRPGQPRTRMPLLPDVSPKLAWQLGLAVASLRAPPPPPWLRQDTPAGPAMPNGKTAEIVERFQCLTCHQLGKAGGEVARVPLTGVGSRLQGPWLERFLQSPVTVRMNQGERMPVFGITAPEAQRLVHWLQSTQADARIEAVQTGQGDAQRGKWLYDKLFCDACHVLGGQGRMEGPNLDDVGQRLQPQYIQAIFELGADVVPEGRHPRVRIEAASARDLTAYLLALPAAATAAQGL